MSERLGGESKSAEAQIVLIMSASSWRYFNGFSQTTAPASRGFKANAVSGPGSHQGLCAAF